MWEWLQHLLDTNQLDASCIPFQEFDISGERLCGMSLHEFTRAAGAAGQLLYSSLQHLKWNGDYLFRGSGGRARLPVTVAGAGKERGGGRTGASLGLHVCPVPREPQVIAFLLPVDFGGDEGWLGIHRRGALRRPFLLSPAHRVGGLRSQSLAC